MARYAVEIDQRGVETSTYVVPAASAEDAEVKVRELLLSTEEDLEPANVEFHPGDDWTVDSDATRRLPS